MLVGEPGRDPPARRAVDKTKLQQVRLVNIHDRIGFLADRGGDGFQADRPALEFLDDGAQHAAVDVVQAERIDVQQIERLTQRLRR